MSDTPRMDHAANESISAVYELGRQLERELVEVTKQRDELADALQRFVNRLQYNSIYMDGKPRCASVNRNPVKEWDEDCIFAFEILERLKGGAQ